MQNIIGIFLLTSFLLATCVGVGTKTGSHIADYRVQRLPIILVHGWGETPRVGPFGRELTELNNRIRPYTNLDTIEARFLAAGYRVHRFHYDDLQSIETMSAQVASQFNTVAAQYAAGQKFDVVTHSMGQFVSLKAILDNGLDGRVHRFVGLAGIAHGLNIGVPCQGGYPLTELESVIVRRLPCGGAEALWQEEAFNPYIKALLVPNAVRIAQLEKCSLFSNRDNIVFSPYDSASFDRPTLYPSNKNIHKELFFNSSSPDGRVTRSVDVIGQGIKIPWGSQADFHVAVKEDKAIFDRMVSECLTAQQL